MSLKQTVSKCLHSLSIAFVAVTVFQFSLGGPLAGSLQAQEKEHTRTPIKHVIVLIGENRTFDHLFATYVPKTRTSCQKESSLLTARPAHISPRLRNSRRLPRSKQSISLVWTIRRRLRTRRCRSRR